MTEHFSSGPSKTAVVTGGTRGIGRAISLELASQGHRVFALYHRDRASAEDLLKAAREKGLEIECLRGDLTHPERFDTLKAELEARASRVDVLVHSAASGVHRGSMELSVKHLAWTLEINLLAAHRIVQGFIGKMTAGGRIVGITSPGATHVIPYYAAIGASKGALEALFRHYAAELAPRGIAVNCVCPGLVLTAAVGAFPDGASRVERALGETPTGRLTTPEDVARVVAFLCGPSAAQIIGQTLVVDGGKSLRG